MQGSRRSVKELLSAADKKGIIHQIKESSIKTEASRALTYKLLKHMY